MDRISVKRVAIVFFVANVIAIAASAFSGYQLGNVAFRFEERQAITYFSSNQLGATALLAWLIYVLRTRLLRGEGGVRGTAFFWAISAVGFLYLMSDESFQFHEGMDTSVFRMFGHRENPLLDGVSTALYGIGAAAVCYYYRAEITRYRSTFALFSLGGVFLALTSALDIGEESKMQIAVEESFKLLGVTSFLLGHLAAFLETVRDIQSDLPAPSRAEQHP